MVYDGAHSFNPLHISLKIPTLFKLHLNKNFITAWCLMFSITKYPVNELCIRNWQRQVTEKLDICKTILKKTTVYRCAFVLFLTFAKANQLPSRPRLTQFILCQIYNKMVISLLLPCVKSCA